MGRTVALLTCLIALFAGTLAPRAAYSAGDSRASTAALEVSVLTELNDIRTAHGLRPLRPNPQLSAAARQHSTEMLADGYFEHESVSGSPFWKRIQRFYAQGTYGHWAVGENLLWSAGSIGAKKALEAWMGSQAHRETILTSGWRDIGISAIRADSSVGAFGGGPVTLITVDFGVRR